MSKKRKILILNYEFPPLGGGAGNATFYLLKELAKQPELDITLVTSSVNQYKEEQFAPNVKIYYLDIGKKGNIHNQSIKDLLTYPWKAYWQIKKLLKTKKFDVTHAFFTVPCAFVAMLFNVPYIVGLRGSDVPYYSEKYYWLDTLFFRFLSKYIWKKAKKVVANSQGLKELAQKTAPQQEIEVIYNGVDTNEFQPAERSDKFIITSTSRLTKRKGLNFLIEGFVKLAEKHHNIELHFIGEGDQMEHLKEMAKSSPCPTKIKFFGAVPHKQIAQLISKANVYALPSLNEGMSNSLLEGMASGLAIIATDTGGTKELVDDSNGIIIKKESSDSIFRALDKLVLDQKLLEQMCQASRQKAESMSWTKMAEKYIKYYKA